MTEPTVPPSPNAEPSQPPKPPTLDHASVDRPSGAIAAGIVIALHFIALFQAVSYLTVLRDTTAAQLEKVHA